jgi:hypothetical protein
MAGLELEPDTAASDQGVSHKRLNQEQFASD